MPKSCVRGPILRDICFSTRTRPQATPCCKRRIRARQAASRSGSTKSTCAPPSAAKALQKNCLPLPIPWAQNAFVSRSNRRTPAPSCSIGSSAFGRRNIAPWSKTFPPLRPLAQVRKRVRLLRRKVRRNVQHRKRSGCAETRSRTKIIYHTCARRGQIVRAARMLVAFYTRSVPVTALPPCARCYTIQGKKALNAEGMAYFSRSSCAVTQV